MAEIPPETLASADVALPGRSMFIDLYTTYCEWLEDEQLYDEATLFAEAQKASSPNCIVGILDETPLSESAYRFITSIGNPLVRIGRSDYGKPGPQHSALVRFQQTSPAREAACKRTAYSPPTEISSRYVRQWELRTKCGAY
jgi:hypothetical protein